ncbi:MAG: DUF1570 domain-containing protein [Phycisphaerae bacterium]|nr:DUF1570 domain-containing protein [Phycisphaerae bacterium]
MSPVEAWAVQSQGGRTDGERRMQKSWWDRTEPGRGGLPTSRFYRLRSDLIAADTKTYGQHLDLLYVEYKRRLGGLEQRTPEILDVLMFATQQDYINTLRERFGINGMGSGGMFFISPRGAALAFWVEGLPRSRVLHVIQHEGFHQFANSRFGNDLPPWVNEGVAEFFGESAVVDGAVIVGQTSERTLNTLRAAISQGKHIRFRDMITMDLERWNANVQSGSAMLQYMQAWSMVHFLVYGDGGKYQRSFEAYLANINRGAKNFEAFVRAFGTDDIDSFEARWIEHAKTARPSAFLTALERAQFLAEGMKVLAMKGIVAESMEDLQQKLEAERFTSQVFAGGGAHGTTVTLTATDHLNFQIPDDDLAKGTPTFELVAAKAKRPTKKSREAEEKVPTPPTLVTHDLAPKNLAVRWLRSKDGERIDFEIELTK